MSAATTSVAVKRKGLSPLVKRLIWIGVLVLLVIAMALSTKVVPKDSELAQGTQQFNAAVQSGTFNPAVKDGKGTRGITPPKSNWATAIERAPYVGIPLITDIVFTYGGLATDQHGRVVDEAGEPLPGLYAVGECTGVYYHKYPGATSVMPNVGMSIAIVS